MHNGRGVVLLGLVLLAGEAALLGARRRGARPAGAAAVRRGRVGRVGAAEDDARANGKDNVEHVRLARGAVALARGVDALEHVHELAAVQRGELRVGVLKVELGEARAQVAVGKGRLADGGLGLQAEEGVAHRGAAVDDGAGRLAAAVAAALRRRARHGALDGREDDAGKRDARRGAQVARVAGALDRDHADVRDELGQLLAVVAVVVLAGGRGRRPTGPAIAVVRRRGRPRGEGRAGGKGRVEVVGGLEGDGVRGQARLEVGDAGLEVVDVAARDLALGDGVVAHALDGGLVARGARRQPLVAAVLAQAAAVAGADVAERARGRGRGRRRGLRRRRGRVGRRGLVAVGRRLLQGALEAAHQGAWQDGRGRAGTRAAQGRARASFPRTRHGWMGASGDDGAGAGAGVGRAAGAARETRDGRGRGSAMARDDRGCCWRAMAISYLAALLSRWLAGRLSQLGRGVAAVVDTPPPACTGRRATGLLYPIHALAASTSAAECLSTLDTAPDSHAWLGPSLASPSAMHRQRARDALHHTAPSTSAHIPHPPSAESVTRSSPMSRRFRRLSMSYDEVAFARPANLTKFQPKTKKKLRLTCCLGYCLLFKRKNAFARSHQSLVPVHESSSV